MYRLSVFTLEFVEKVKEGFNQIFFLLLKRYYAGIARLHVIIIAPPTVIPNLT